MLSGRTQQCGMFCCVLSVIVPWILLQRFHTKPLQRSDTQPLKSYHTEPFPTRPPAAVHENLTDCWGLYKHDIDTKRSTSFVPGHSVMMEPTSVKMLCSLLTPQTRVLEWGSGGSTLFFSRFVRRWDTIEHDTAWVAQMRRLVQGMPNVHLHSATHSWDKFGDGNYTQFQEYVDLPAHLGLHYDVVLVDRRARIACAHAVAIYQLTAPGGIVIVHDWERIEYKSVLREFDLVQEDTVGRRHLGVLQLKGNGAG